MQSLFHDGSESLFTQLCKAGAVIVAFMAFLVGYYEYRNHVDKTKVDRSLAFEEYFTSPELWRVHRELNDAFRQAWDFVEKELEEMSEIEKQKIDIYIYYAVNAIIEERNLYNEIEVIATVFQRAAICVEKEMCDKSVLDGFMKRRGSNFFIFAGPYICKIRRIWGDNEIWAASANYYLPDPEHYCPYKTDEEIKEKVEQNRHLFNPTSPQPQ